ncbi:MAG: hypothetical protein U1E76_17545 [Planctomycetota bacterium]
MDSSQGRLAALAFGALTLLAVGAHARPRVDLGVQNENDITINATSTDLGNGCRRICYEVTLAANAENENLLDFHVEVNSADASLFSDFDVDKKQADGTWADTHWWEGKHGSQVEGNANHHYIDFYSPYGNEKMKKGNTYRFCVTYCGAATNLDSTIEFLATNSGNALPGIPDATGNRADVPDDPNTNQDDEGWKGPWSAGTGAKVGFLLSAKSASDSSLWVAPQRGLMDAGVVISVPSGSSDYYSLAQEVKPGNGNSEQLAGEQLVAGVAVSVADFGSGLTYPMIGVFSPNLGLDPSGNTPDLVNAITAIYSPVNPTAASLLRWLRDAGDRHSRRRHARGGRGEACPGRLGNPRRRGRCWADPVGGSGFLATATRLRRLLRARSTWVSASLRTIPARTRAALPITSRTGACGCPARRSAMPARAITSPPRSQAATCSRSPSSVPSQATSSVCTTLQHHARRRWPSVRCCQPSRMATAPAATCV